MLNSTSPMKDLFYTTHDLLNYLANRYKLKPR